jgi:putative oxidoreductase
MNEMTTNQERPGRGLHIGLWVAQVLLALAFGMSGLWKATTPMAQLAEKLPLAAGGHAALLRFIGVSELLGALGLILPAVTRILPRLTALAALGLTVVMVLATGYHLSRGEAGALPVTLGLGALSAFVAWGRGRRAPVAPRGLFVKETLGRAASS